MKTVTERVNELVIVEDDIIFVDGNQIGDADNTDLVTRRAAKLRAVLVREIEYHETWRSEEDLRNVADLLRKKSSNLTFSKALRAKHARAAAYLELAYAELVEIL